MIFAQAIGGIGFWEVVKYAVDIVAIVAGAYAIMVARRKFEKVKISPQPLRATIEGEVETRSKARRFNAEACDLRHAGIVDRLDGHDDDIAELWRTMRAEDKEMRDQLLKTVKELDARMAELPSQIVALLKNTGQIIDHKRS